MKYIERLLLNGWSIDISCGDDGYFYIAADKHGEKYQAFHDMSLSKALEDLLEQLPKGAAL